MNLSAARVETFEMDCVAWFDREPWRKSAVPAGMCRPGRKIVFGHGARLQQSFAAKTASTLAHARSGLISTYRQTLTMVYDSFRATHSRLETPHRAVVITGSAAVAL